MELLKELSRREWSTGALVYHDSRPAQAVLAEDGLYVLEHKTEFIRSRRDETSADATEAAVASSKDERICLKERML